MAGFSYSTVEGNLTLNGVAMKTPAWTCPDLTPLWLPPTVRGQDRLLPGAPGVRPHRRRKTVTEYALDFRVSGLADRFGVAPAGTGNGVAEFQQLEENMNYLRQYVLDTTASANSNGTIPGVLTMPSGAVRTAAVHVIGFSVNVRVSHILQGTLDISIPSGGFV